GPGLSRPPPCDNLPTHLREEQEQPTMPAQVQFQRITLLLLSALFALSACNINVKKNEQGEDKNVDIKTPFGDIHVDKGADVKDTGLPVYAGARVKQKNESDNDEKSANANNSTGAYGLRVVSVASERGHVHGALPSC